MGGSNQMLFLLGALIAGQGSIPGQGSAAVPLLILGLLLSWAAAFGWTELVMMWPNRVGGIAATCAEAFRPISPVLANLTGVCYWWGWVPTCGLTALLSASALNQWFLPGVPAPVLAKLRAETNRLLADPDMREKVRSVGGLEPFISTPEEFAALIRTEHAKYGEVVKAVGVKID